MNFTPELYSFLRQTQSDIQQLITKYKVTALPEEKNSLNIAAHVLHTLLLSFEALLGKSEENNGFLYAIEGKGIHQIFRLYQDHPCKHYIATLSELLNEFIVTAAPSALAIDLIQQLGRFFCLMQKFLKEGGSIDSFINDQKSSFGVKTLLALSGYGDTFSLPYIQRYFAKHRECLYEKFREFLREFGLIASNFDQLSISKILAEFEKQIKQSADDLGAIEQKLTQLNLGEIHSPSAESLTVQVVQSKLQELDELNDKIINVTHVVHTKGKKLTELPDLLYVGWHSGELFNSDLCKEINLKSVQYFIHLILEKVSSLWGLWADVRECWQQKQQELTEEFCTPAESIRAPDDSIQGFPLSSLTVQKEREADEMQEIDIEGIRSFQSLLAQAKEISASNENPLVTQQFLESLVEQNKLYIDLTSRIKKEVELLQQQITENADLIKKAEMQRDKSRLRERLQAQAMKKLSDDHRLLLVCKDALEKELPSSDADWQSLLLLLGFDEKKRQEWFAIIKPASSLYNYLKPLIITAGEKKKPEDLLPFIDHKISELVKIIESCYKHNISALVGSYSPLQQVESDLSLLKQENQKLQQEVDVAQQKIVVLNQLTTEAENYIQREHQCLQECLRKYYAQLLSPSKLEGKYQHFFSAISTLADNITTYDSDQSHPISFLSKLYAKPNTLLQELKRSLHEILRKIDTHAKSVQFQQILPLKQELSDLLPQIKKITEQDRAAVKEWYRECEKIIMLAKQIDDFESELLQKAASDLRPLQTYRV